jgi:ATP-dependent exoDNAse (exonuclease V) beta subunit
MPALYGIEEKYFNGYKVDKENDHVVYSDEQHVYLDKEDCQKYISVTQLIHAYSNEFDAEFWSAYKALEAILDQEVWLSVKGTLLTRKKFDRKLLSKLDVDESIFDEKQKEILAEYDRKREESCIRGTEIHRGFEESFYGKNRFNFKQFGFEEIGDYDFTCKKDYFKLDLSRGVYPEFLISCKSEDGILRLSGQIDCLIIDENDVYILDFKTNKEIKKSGYFDKVKKQKQTLKFPLNELDDCNFNIYQLQLSVYAYMLQTLKPELNIKKLMLYHIDHDGNETLYECQYLKKDVIRMLNHYKKQLKIQQELNKNKPIKM